MRLLVLCGLPLATALIVLGAPHFRRRRVPVVLLVTVAAAHLALVISLWTVPSRPALGGWLAADALGLTVLTLTSVLFFVTTIYIIGYIRRDAPPSGRVFTGCLLAFLAAASIVSLAHHLALLWVGMEATTLSVAPLVFLRRDRRSLEATWKYLVVSSVGIALALLGTFFLSSAQGGSDLGYPLLLPDLIAHARELNPAWLRAAFLFLLVGFGTKMGLAPMHTWKPDTYGEAPSLVGGLMAGALTSCAFLGVGRVTEVVAAAGLASFARPALIAFGLVSLAVAATFIVGQGDVKRLLAYSSVEHMGLLVLGLGLGGVGAYGSMLHLVNNSLAKGWLFLVTGNIVLATGSATAAANRGLIRTLPASAILLVLGLFAVTGSPPFGLFMSEFTILRAAIDGGHPWIAAIVLVALMIIFVGMAALVLGITLGEPDAASRSQPVRESPWLIVGPTALAAVVLLLGLYIPEPLQEVLARAAALLGGRAGGAGGP
ncbi:MAG TPA: proton-conducting transporter membrane subunit [Gemmatimonadales bacterium]|nr:proton-conducting transporter membrane subunit [Gemmatimonadales bacterium]